MLKEVNILLNDKIKEKGIQVLKKSGLDPAQYGSRLDEVARYALIAAQSALSAGIPPALFVRQIHKESAFNPKASNPSGADGIAQIIPKWHPGVNTADPEEALNYSAKWMAKYYNLGKTNGLDDLSAYKRSAIAYNAGPNSEAYKQGRLPEETARYVDFISNFKSYEEPPKNKKEAKLRFTSPYGNRQLAGRMPEFNQGPDFVIDGRQEVPSLTNGVIVNVGVQGDGTPGLKDPAKYRELGYYVDVKADDGTYYRYGHLDPITDFKKLIGAPVKQGTILGGYGIGSGSGTGQHVKLYRAKDPEFKQKLDPTPIMKSYAGGILEGEYAQVPQQTIPPAQQQVAQAQPQQKQPQINLNFNTEFDEEYRNSLLSAFTNLKDQQQLLAQDNAQLKQAVIQKQAKEMQQLEEQQKQRKETQNQEFLASLQPIPTVKPEIAPIKLNQNPIGVTDNNPAEIVAKLKERQAQQGDPFAKMFGTQQS